MGSTSVYDEEEKGYRVTKSYAGSENGLKEGDIIKAVIDENGETLQVSEHNDDKLIPLIRGQVGTTAKLLVNKERKPREIIRRLMDVEKGAALDIKALLQVPVLQERLEQQEKNLGKLTERLEGLERGFTEQLEEHKKQTNEKFTGLEEAQQQTQEQLTTHKDKTNAALTEQKDSIDGINARVDRLGETVESNQQSINGLSGTVADNKQQTNKKLTGLEEAQQQTQEQLTGLSETVANNQRTNQEAIANVTEQFAAHEQKLTTTNTKVDEVEQTITDNQKTNQEGIAGITEQLEEHKQQTQEQLTTTNTKVDRLGETVDSNQQSINGLTEQFTTYKGETTQIQEQLTAANTRVGEVEQTITDNQKTNQEGIAGITEQLEEHKQQTQEQLTTTNTKVDGLSETVADNQQQTNEKFTGLEEAQQKTQQQVGELSETVDSNQQQTNEKFEEKHTAFTDILERRVASVSSESEIALNTAISQVYSTTDNKIAAEITAREEATTTQNQSIAGLREEVINRHGAVDQKLNELEQGVIETKNSQGGLNDRVGSVENSITQLPTATKEIIDKSLADLGIKKSYFGIATIKNAPTSPQETPENSQGSGRSGDSQNSR